MACQNLSACGDQCFITVDKEQISDLYNMMSAKVRKDLQEEYDCKRISGATYAEAFTQLMNGVIQQSFQTVVAVQNKETSMDRCVKQTTCDLNEAKKKAEDIKNGDISAPDSIYDKNKEVLEKQGSLLDRQKEGYDDNKLQKLFDSQIKAWSVVFQDTDMTCVTPVIMNDAMVGVFNELAPSEIDIEKPYYPEGSSCSESGTGGPEG